MFGALSSWGASTPGKNRAPFGRIQTNDGINLAYEVFGSGNKQVIVLIHGTCVFRGVVFHNRMLLVQDGLARETIGTEMPGYGTQRA